MRRRRSVDGVGENGVERSPTSGRKMCLRCSRHDPGCSDPVRVSDADSSLFSSGDACLLTSCAVTQRSLETHAASMRSRFATGGRLSLDGRQRSPQEYSCWGSMTVGPCFAHESFNMERTTSNVYAQRMGTRSVVLFRSAPRRTRSGGRGRDCVGAWVLREALRELSVPVTDPNRVPALRGGGRGAGCVRVAWKITAVLCTRGQQPEEVENLDENGLTRGQGSGIHLGLHRPSSATGSIEPDPPPAPAALLSCGPTHRAYRQPDRRAPGANRDQTKTAARRMNARCP